MNYPYGFDFDVDLLPGSMGAGVLGVILAIYMLTLLLALAWSVVAYVLFSKGIYTIARRRGIRCAGLAWVPLGNLWILGSISDQYQYLVKGRIKNRRKVLLALGIGVYALDFIWLAVTSANTVAGTDITAILGMLGGSLLMLAVAVVMLVVEYKALYDLYRSCKPSSAILYLVLTIVLSVPMPFFVFACRKKEMGMPPRKQPAPQQVVVPTVEVVVDPNVVEKVVVPTVEPVVESAAEPVTEEGYANPEEFEEE